MASTIDDRGQGLTLKYPCCRMRQGSMSHGEAELAEWIEQSQITNVVQHIPNLLIR